MRARPGSRIADLQRLAGNAAVTRLVHGLRAAEGPAGDLPVPDRDGRSGQPEAAGPAGTAAPVVQRKVGFEFETGLWQPWKLLREVPGGSRFSPGRLMFGDDDIDGDRVVPVPRQAVLEKGTGFRLEADDTPGPRWSSLEFVTDPFEETTTGLAELQQALRSMLTITGRLDKYVGREGPETYGLRPPYPVIANTKASRYVRHWEHRLGSSAEVGIPGTDLLLSGGQVGFPVTMQSTSGLPLPDLPSMMESLGRDVPGESKAQAELRRRYRATMFPPDVPARGTLKRIGSAPTLARDMVTTLGRHPDYRDALAGGTSELTGFLAAVVMCAGLLQHPNAPGDHDLLVKKRLTLMPRNTFVQMFEALPADQKLVLAKTTDPLIGELIRVLNAHLGRSLTASSPLIAPSADPVRGEAALATLTIGDWVRGFVAGKDYLSRQGMEAWLSRDENLRPAARKDALDGMESIATYPSSDRREGTGEELFMFENRGIGPTLRARGGTRRLPMKDAAQNAVEIFGMYMAIRRAGERRRSAPGSTST